MVLKVRVGDPELLHPWVNEQVFVVPKKGL